MQKPFIDNPEKMKEEYSIAKRFWDNLDFKNAAIHYAESIKFSGGNGINTNNFKTYYELGLTFSAYGDYRGAVSCYSVAVYLDKGMQEAFKSQYTKFEDIASLPRGVFKLLIVSYSWQFGHALLDHSTDIQKFPNWEKYILEYRDFIRRYRDRVPFSYPDYMIDLYPREVVDFYMKAGIELAENAMKLDDSKIEAIIDYILVNSIPALTGSKVKETSKAQSDTLETNVGKASPKAQYDLGMMYLNGLGVDKDINKGIELLYKAAVQGDAKAQVQLGNMYFSGEILEKNNQEAFKYYANAYEQGNKEAEAGLEKLLSKCNSIAMRPSPEYPATQKKILEVMFKKMSKEETDTSKNVEKINNEKICNEKSVIEKEKEIIDEGIKAKRAGNYEKSIECYTEAVHLIPENGNTYYALGKVLYIVGRYTEAFRSYLLAYLHNANCFKKDLFIHAGHAILDIENSKSPDYCEVIKEYTASIKGELPIIDGIYQDYTDICEAKGKEEILHQAKSHARD